MNTYAKRKILPLGCIRARGFLKEQLLRSKNGMGGHLPEIVPEMIADPYLRKAVVKQWDGGEISGRGTEISGNYYAGLIRLAFTLNDGELKDFRKFLPRLCGSEAEIQREPHRRLRRRRAPARPSVRGDGRRKVSTFPARCGWYG